jgi:hypothetical protein
MDNADKQRHATQSNPAHTKLHLVLKLLLPLRCIATRLMESIRSCAVKLTVVLAFAGAMPSLGWAEKDPQERVSGNQKQTRSQLEVNNLFGSHTPVTLKVIPGRQGY